MYKTVLNVVFQMNLETSKALLMDSILAMCPLMWTQCFLQNKIGSPHFFPLTYHDIMGSKRSNLDWVWFDYESCKITSAFVESCDLHIGVANNFKIDLCLHQCGRVFSIQKQNVEFGVKFFLCHLFKHYNLLMNNGSPLESVQVSTPYS